MSDDDPNCSHSNIDMDRLICRDCYHQWYSKAGLNLHIFMRDDPPLDPKMVEDGELTKEEYTKKLLTKVKKVQNILMGDKKNGKQ